jgi:hypothetical protein
MGLRRQFFVFLRLEELLRGRREFLENGILTRYSPTGILEIKIVIGEQTLADMVTDNNRSMAGIDQRADRRPTI